MHVCGAYYLSVITKVDAVVKIMKVLLTDHCVAAVISNVSTVYDLLVFLCVCICICVGVRHTEIVKCCHHTT